MFRRNGRSSLRLWTVCERLPSLLFHSFAMKPPPLAVDPNRLCHSGEDLVHEKKRVCPTRSTGKRTHGCVVHRIPSRARLRREGAEPFLLMKEIGIGASEPFSWRFGASSRIAKTKRRLGRQGDTIDPEARPLPAGLEQSSHGNRYAGGASFTLKRLERILLSSAMVLLGSALAWFGFYAQAKEEGVHEH